MRYPTRSQKGFALPTPRFESQNEADRRRPIYDVRVLRRTDDLPELAILGLDELAALGAAYRLAAICADVAVKRPAPPGVDRCAWVEKQADDGFIFRLAAQSCASRIKARTTLPRPRR